MGKKPQAAQPGVEAVDPPGPFNRAQIKVDTERDRYGLEILRPMGRVTGNVYGGTGMHVEYSRIGLPLGSVFGGADVASVEALQFLRGHERRIARVEDAQALVAVN